MSKYIEREAVIELITSRYENQEICTAEINSIPAADVAPVVHAQPVLFYDDPFTGRRFTTCSNCEGKIGKRDRYCKHCGARMDGGTQ